MKVVFAGTPQFAVAPLQKIVESGFEVVGVITQADKPQGRKGILTPPPVKTYAQSMDIPVLQPTKIEEALPEILELGGDILVTCAYGQILTQPVLDAFSKGVWNIHAGLLPAYRGASPIQSCILAGEEKTGVTIIQTELGLDSGPILLEQRTSILPEETYGELSTRLSLLGAELIVKALGVFKMGSGYALTPQGSEGVGVVRKIDKKHAQIRFDCEGKKIVDLVRAMNPAPVAFAVLDGASVNVLSARVVELSALSEEELCSYQNAAFGEVIGDTPKRGLLVKCKGGVVRLTSVQLAGGKVMKDADLLNGRKVRKGQTFVW